MSEVEKNFREDALYASQLNRYLHTQAYSYTSHENLGNSLIEQWDYGSYYRKSSLACYQIPSDHLSLSGLFNSSSLRREGSTTQSKRGSQLHYFRYHFINCFFFPKDLSECC